MTSFKMIAACSAALAMSVASLNASAQDDLDDLLKDLEGETAKPAEKPAAAEAPKAEEPAAEEAKAEPAVAEKASATSANEKVAAAADEAAEPNAMAEEAASTAEAEASAAVKGSSDKVDDVLNLLDQLAEESSSEKTADKTAEPNAVAADKTAEPNAVAASETLEPKATGVSAADKTAEPKAKKVEKSAAAKRPDEELLVNIATTERLRRDSLDAQAKREILSARASMEAKEFTDAVRHYGLAVKLLNDSPASKALRKECDQGIAEGLYRAALQEDEIGRRAKAVALMEKALEMRHPKARRALEKWTAQSDVDVTKTDFSEASQRRNDEDYKAERDVIRRHLRRSRQYLALRDMSRALDECESVLKVDPYNQEAIRLRRAIQNKRQTILRQERVAARDGMIADVDEAWRPVYAVNAAQLAETTSETVKSNAGEDPERTMEQDIEKRMREMRLPTIEFKPPATIIEAVEFFRTASRDYDRPDIPIEKRGFNFVLRTPVGAIKQQAAQEEASNDFSSNAAEDTEATANGLPPIPKITASDISFYDALKLVCDSVDYKFIVRGPIVMVMQKDMSTAELLSRKYNVPEAFVERVNSASEEMKEMGGFGASNRQAKKADEEGEGEGRDWKAFFEEMGVKWPEGSSIKHIKALGKLYVRNTRENLAEFEKVLDELGGQPQLIEIETRFVEVSQEDLNSLGFEWILNSNMPLTDRFGLGKALGLKNAGYVTETTGGETVTVPDRVITRTEGGTTITETIKGGTRTLGTATTSSKFSRGGASRTVGVDAFGGSSDYQNGNRYLSTVGNHISGEAASNNDQFMRVNAFLGQADLSMILHMLSQRSDTDLLSAPKVVTKSGEQAIIKVVTEYIYPQDYNVQLQSSSSGSSGGTSGGGQSAILAVVEPQNFTMREVGVILDVIPTYSEANGGTIDLELKPAVIDEPIWYNYGMRIPFTGNTSSGTMADIGNIFTGMSTALAQIGATLTPDETAALAKNVVASATDAAANVSTSSSSTMTWYDAPMQQPFFHVRSIESKVSITPGATVVMGGLITEARKAMDDKIPFLGDLPYIGRLFRSHAEKTTKRNLLIFVTGRLITPSGRELRVNQERATDAAEVKPAPKAE